jgi:hypothetical protein
MGGTTSSHLGLHGPTLRSTYGSRRLRGDATSSLNVVDLLTSAVWLTATRLPDGPARHRSALQPLEYRPLAIQRYKHSAGAVKLSNRTEPDVGTIPATTARVSLGLPPF